MLQFKFTKVNFSICSYIKFRSKFCTVLLSDHKNVEFFVTFDRMNRRLMPRMTRGLIQYASGRHMSIVLWSQQYAEDDFDMV